MKDIYIDPQITPISKLGFFGKLKFKVSKSDVADLIDSINDIKIINTIKYIYNIRGDLLPYDLIIIRDNVNKFLDNHYDQKIKGMSTSVNEEKVIEVKNSVEKVQNLIDKYFPEPKDRD